MSRYTEALRKVEEERVRKIHEPVVSSAHFSFRKYVVGTSVTALVIIILVYAYGVYSGTRLKKKSPSKEPAVISPVSQVSTANQNALLPGNVEKMTSLSAQPIVPKTQVNTQVVRPITVKETDFYAIQLVAYEQEETAKAEAQKLLQKGFKPLILHGPKMFKVCVGKFSTKERAEEGLQRIKMTKGLYHDAFVRFVKAKNSN